MTDRRYTLRLHTDCDAEQAISAHLDGLRSGRRAEIIRRLIVAGWQAQQGVPRAPVTAPQPQPTPAPTPAPQPASTGADAQSATTPPPSDDADADPDDPMARLRAKLGVGGGA